MGPIELEKIPQELKDRRQWVVWKAENRNGRPTKVPYRPADPRKKAKADDPDTWGTFNQAAKVWEVHKDNGIAGIGYEFSFYDKLCGVDLDKCRNPETGELRYCAHVLLEYLNSYSEISPSETGIHTFLKGKWPLNEGNTKATPCGMKWEFFGVGKYFTMTGHHLPETPATIEPRQEQLTTLHRIIFAKPNPQPKDSGPSPTLDFSDQELIDKAKRAANGEKFSKLWMGNWQAYYPTQNEADQALCNLLSFWTGKDYERIERLFGRSKLNRDKWEKRPDYRMRTINKAIANTTEVYTPGGGENPKRGNGRGQTKDTRKKAKSPDMGNAPHPEWCPVEEASQADPVAALNNKHAVILVGGKCAVMNETTDPVFGRPDISFSSVADFKNFYANHKVEIPKDDGSVALVPLAKKWLESPERRQYQGIVFEPGRIIPGYYNLYKGLAVEPRQGDWSKSHYHLKEVIAAGVEEHYQYLLKWMAYLVQNPGGHRPGTAIVLRGGRGVGKGCLGNNYGRIFGNHFLHIAHPTHLTGRFNSHFKDCILCFVDEALWAGDKTAEGVLKARITEPTTIIEAKGKDPFTVTNHLNLIIASNSDWIVPAGMDERRFFVLDVSNKHQRDQDYFNAIHQELDNGGLEAMLYDLLQMEVNIDELRQVPNTAALFDQKIYAMSAVQKFWFECLKAGFLPFDKPWEDWISTEDLHKAYIEFAQNCGERFRHPPEIFIKELKKLCPPLKHSKRHNQEGIRKPGYFFPELEKCLETFEKKVNTSITWEEDDGEPPF